jgi:uncharacterized protein
MSLSPNGVPEDVPREEPAVPVTEPVPRRIPNIGHALLFVSFAGLMLFVLNVLLLAIGRLPATLQDGAIKVQYPKVQIAMMAGTYLTTLLAAWFYYPVVWRRSFVDGVQWNWAIARRQFGQLVALGFVLGLMMQIVTYFITPPKTMPIDEFFSSAATAWLITIFGTVMAPVFEEICFRGFLVPAFAIAYDWLSLPRTEESRMRWQTTTTLTPASLVFSAVVSSLCFAMLHTQQVAHLPVALTALFSLSLVLTFVRVKMKSVAASVIVHGAYNGFVFITVLFATGGYRHLDRMTH